MAETTRPHDQPTGRKKVVKKRASRRQASRKPTRELVLLVDDEPGILTALSGVLTDEGFRCVVTGSGEEAVEIYRKQHPEVVFLDIWLPDRDGLETLQALREIDPGALEFSAIACEATHNRQDCRRGNGCDRARKYIVTRRAAESVRARQSRPDQPRRAD